MVNGLLQKTVFPMSAALANHKKAPRFCDERFERFTGPCQYVATTSAATGRRFISGTSPAFCLGNSRAPIGRTAAQDRHRTTGRRSKSKPKIKIDRHLLPDREARHRAVAGKDVRTDGSTRRRRLRDHVPLFAVSGSATTLFEEKTPEYSASVSARSARAHSLSRFISCHSRL